MAASDDRETRYEIRVLGVLDADWEAYVGGSATSLAPCGGEAPVSRLVVAVADQAALRGLLCRLWDMNLTLISMRRIPPGGLEHGSG